MGVRHIEWTPGARLGYEGDNASVDSESVHVVVGCTRVELLGPLKMGFASSARFAMMRARSQGGHASKRRYQKEYVEHDRARASDSRFGPRRAVQHLALLQTLRKCRRAASSFARYWSSYDLRFRGHNNRRYHNCCGALDSQGSNACFAGVDLSCRITAL